MVEKSVTPKESELPVIDSKWSLCLFTYHIVILSNLTPKISTFQIHITMEMTWKCCLFRALDGSNMIKVGILSWIHSETLNGIHRRRRRRQYKAFTFFSAICIIQLWEYKFITLNFNLVYTICLSLFNRSLSLQKVYLVCFTRVTLWKPFEEWQIKIETMQSQFING